MSNDRRNVEKGGRPPRPSSPPPAPPPPPPPPPATQEVATGRSRTMLPQEIAPLRLAVWNGLLDAERYLRYYGALAERYRRQHQIPRYIMAVAPDSRRGNSHILRGAVPTRRHRRSGPGSFWPAVAWDLLSDHGRKGRHSGRHQRRMRGV